MFPLRLSSLAVLQTDRVDMAVFAQLVQGKVLWNHQACERAQEICKSSPLAD